MADVVYELLAKIGVDSSGLSQGLDDAKKDIDSSGVAESLDTKFTLASAAIVAGGVAVTKAVGKTIKGLTSLATGSAAYADGLLTAATVTGLSTERLQEFNYMAELVDVSTDTITNSMRKLTKAMANGSDDQAAAFEQLGVSVTDNEGNLRDNYDVFLDVIDALGQVENETERDAISMTLFGQKAQNLNPLIAQGAEGLEKFAEEARELGYVLSDEDLKNLGALDDSMQRFTNFKKTVSNRLGLAMAPAVERVLDKFLELGNKIDWEKVGEKLGNALELGADKLIGFVENVDFDKLLDGATTLFDAVISGISWVLEHADDILKFISSVGAGLLLGKGINSASGLFGNLFGGGKNIVSRLLGGGGTTAGAASGAGGLSFGSLLPALPIASILAGVGIGAKQGSDYFNEKWAENAVDVDATEREIEAKIAELEEKIATKKQDIANSELFGTYDQASHEELAILEAALADAEQKLAESQARNTENANAWGVDMMNSMANGITIGANSSLIPAVANVAQAIWELLHHSEPEKGPLADDSTWMPDMMHGFAEGIKKGAPEVQNAVKSAFDVKSYTGFGMGGVGGGITINVNGARYNDDASLAERIAYEIRNIFDREEAAYA